MGNGWCTPRHHPSATTLRSAFLAQRDTGELALGRCFTGISTAIYLRALTWLRAGGRAEGSLVPDPRWAPPSLSHPERSLATAAFDQAVTFLLFTYHEHVSIMQLVGRWGVLRCRYWWDLGPLPPYGAHAPIFGPSPTLGCAPVWARGQRCLKLKDLVSSSGVAVALLGLPSQLRVCRTKRRVTSVSDAAGPGAAHRASAALLKRPEPGSKIPSSSMHLNWYCF